MQIRNDRRLSPWDLERDSSVLFPIALEDSPDVQRGEIWQGVTKPAVTEREDREKRPQVLAIKINLARKSKKRIPWARAPPRTARGSWKRSRGEGGGCTHHVPRWKQLTCQRNEVEQREEEALFYDFLLPLLSKQPCVCLQNIFKESSTSRRRRNNMSKKSCGLLPPDNATPPFSSSTVNIVFCHLLFPLSLQAWSAASYACPTFILNIVTGHSHPLRWKQSLVCLQCSGPTIRHHASTEALKGDGGRCGGGLIRLSQTLSESFHQILMSLIEVLRHYKASWRESAFMAKYSPGLVEQTARGVQSCV